MTNILTLFEFVIAKTYDCERKGVRKVGYLFEGFNSIYPDKREVLQAQIERRKNILSSTTTEDRPTFERDRRASGRARPRILRWMDLGTSLELNRLYEERLDRPKAHFIICQCCFWCASSFGMTKDSSICPNCDRTIIDSSPISENKSYRVQIRENGNVELEFRKKDDYS